MDHQNKTLRFTGPVDEEIEKLVRENEMLVRYFKELWEENIHLK